MDPREHWQAVYDAKRPEAVSWYQPVPEPSLEALARLGADHTTSLIDVGGGASQLAGELMGREWHDVSVLDIAGSALATSKERAGDRSGLVHWIEADVRSWRPVRTFDIWHDRAVFHFLTAAEDRAGYRRALLAATRVGSRVILATFAPDGPAQCSGLPVRRYGAKAMATELGPDFELQEEWREEHVTPWGAVQQFQWGIFIRK
jgi:trans-aconitate methyltransferase